MCDPVITASIISAGASYLSGESQKAGAKDIAEKEFQAQRENMRMFRESQDRALAMNQPFIEAGRVGLSGLEEIAKSPIELSPLAQFRQRQLERDILSSSAGRAGISSGRTMRAIGDLSGQITGEETQRRQNILTGLAGMGQTAAGSASMLASQFPQYKAITSGIEGTALGNINQMMGINDSLSSMLLFQRLLGNKGGMDLGNMGSTNLVPSDTILSRNVQNFLQP